MKSIVLEAPGRLTVADAAEPDAPRAGEATVRVLRVGICGTDLHAYKGNQPFMAYPVILGHELAVEIVALGPEAPPKLSVGTRCTVVPYLADGTCPACQRGKPNCCASLKVLGVHIDGGMRERLNLPTWSLIPADDIDLESLALVEMLAIGAHAVRRARLADEDTVLVVGAGPIGLSILAFARGRANRVLAIDKDPSRTAFLAQAGLCESLEVDEEIGVRSQLLARLGGTLPNIVIDATGHRGSMEQTVDLVDYGGRVVFVGHTKGALEFENPKLHGKELELVFSRNANHADFEQVLAELRGGRLDISTWISTRASMTDLVDALPGWTQPGSHVIKAVASWASGP